MDPKCSMKIMLYYHPTTFYAACSNLGHFEIDNWDALKTQTVLKCVPFFLWCHKYCASCYSLTRPHCLGNNWVSPRARISWICYIMIWPRGPWTLCYITGADCMSCHVSYLSEYKVVVRHTGLHNWVYILLIVSLVYQLAITSYLNYL